MQISPKYGIIYLITKFGFLFVYELSTVSFITRVKISQDTIFIGTRNSKTDGIYCINKGGSLLTASIDENSIVGHIMTQCQYIPDNANLALRYAQRYRLPGCEPLLIDQFNRFIISQDYNGAARIAAGAPGTLLRNAETIARFKTLPAIPGQPQPILVYFQVLLEKGKLNSKPKKNEEN